MTDVLSPDLLVVGAGPAGSATAIHASRLGLQTLLIDAATFPRDKTCGDGLTPRAIAQLESLGVRDDVLSRYHNRGLKLHGFGGSVTAPWPQSRFGTLGSAMPRTQFDALLLHRAEQLPGVSVLEGAEARTVDLTGSRISQVTVLRGEQEYEVRPRTVIVADGVRSPFGKQLGRRWHRGEVYGIAARSYCDSPLSHTPWIHSHLELRDEHGVTQPGYGWVFPLGDAGLNVGCGALSTDRRPARINTKRLLASYAQSLRGEWQMSEPARVSSALLPMGGAVSQVAGPNWMLIGDAAACVNPLNGEGIDYGLETGALAAQLATTKKDLTFVWPDTLRREYGDAFVLARTLARALTYPQFLPLCGPIALRGPAPLMRAAARLMGNLVTEEDRDLVGRLWRRAGHLLGSRRTDAPLWS